MEGCKKILRPEITFGDVEMSEIEKEVTDMLQKSITLCESLEKLCRSLLLTIPLGSPEYSKVLKILAEIQFRIGRAKELFNTEKE